MNVYLLLVPYDTGRCGWRMGAGPEHLLAAGLPAFLEGRGHHIRTELILDDPAADPAEIRTAFELMRRVAVGVRQAREAGRFPLVLSGNCNTAVGVVAGLAPAPRTVWWFDAHGDLNTPDTTTTGFLDGTGLATVHGVCWQALAATVPGFAPVPSDQITLLGARDLDPPEAALLASAGIACLAPARLLPDLAARLARAPGAGTLGYLHCDLDVLDPQVGQVNPFPAPDGLSLDTLTAAVRAIGAAQRLGAAALTAYAPAYDTTGAICRAAFTVAATVLEAAAN